MNSDLRTGLFSVAGVQTGLAVYTALAVLGLSVVIAPAPVLFKAIAVAGALNLGWVGMQGFRAPVLSLDDGGATASPAAAWRHGFFSNLMNPKVILLYLALLPSFVETELGAPEVHLAILGLTIIAINIVWQGFLVAAAGHMRRWLRSPSVQWAIFQANSAILIAFAIAKARSNLAA